MELYTMNKKRAETEDLMQQMKNKIIQDQLSLRQALNQIENQKREIVNLSTTISIAKRENDDLRGELGSVKETLSLKHMMYGSQMDLTSHTPKSVFDDHPYSSVSNIALNQSI